MKQSGSNIFNICSLFQRLSNNYINFLDPKNIHNPGVSLRHVIFGKDTHPLKSYLKRSYLLYDIKNAEEF